VGSIVNDSRTKTPESSHRERVGMRFTLASKKNSVVALCSSQIGSSIIMTVQQFCTAESMLLQDSPGPKTRAELPEHPVYLSFLPLGSSKVNTTLERLAKSVFILPSSVHNKTDFLHYFLQSKYRNNSAKISLDRLTPGRCTPSKLNSKDWNKYLCLQCINLNVYLYESRASGNNHLTDKIWNQ
jgi:hypothetical protein